MKKRFSLIAVAIFSICLLSFFNLSEKRSIQYADKAIIVIPPITKISGKKTKTVIPPTKKRVSTASYRTMA